MFLPAFFATPVLGPGPETAGGEATGEPAWRLGELSWGVSRPREPLVFLVRAVTAAVNCRISVPMVIIDAR